MLFKYVCITSFLTKDQLSLSLSLFLCMKMFCSLAILMIFFIMYIKEFWLWCALVQFSLCLCVCVCMQAFAWAINLLGCLRLYFISNLKTFHLLIFNFFLRLTPFFQGTFFYVYYAAWSCAHKLLMLYTCIFIFFSLCLILNNFLLCILSTFLNILNSFNIIFYYFYNIICVMYENHCSIYFLLFFNCFNQGDKYFPRYCTLEF